MGAISPEIAFAIVDFPLPDSPTRPTVSPGEMSNDTPRTTGIGLFPMKYRPRSHTYAQSRSFTAVWPPPMVFPPRKRLAGAGFHGCDSIDGVAGRKLEVR